MHTQTKDLEPNAAWPLHQSERRLHRNSRNQHLFRFCDAHTTSTCDLEPTNATQEKMGRFGGIRDRYLVRKEFC